MSDPLPVLSGATLPGIDRFWPQGGPVPRIQLQFDKPAGFVRAAETQIPRDRPGIYVYCDDSGRPIYVGKAICLRKRLLSYARGTEADPAAEPLFKELQILRESRRAVIGPCLDELGALVWERELIATWKPRWNRSHNLPPRRWLWLIRSEPVQAKRTKKGAVRRFQMKAIRPEGITECWGPFRGGRWTSALRSALNAELPGVSASVHEALALSFLQGQERTLLRLWEKHIGKVCEKEGAAGALGRDPAALPGPLEQFQALLSFERWRVRVARSKGWTGYCPIASLGPHSWNCSLPPGQAYFYALQEGRILGAIPSPRHAQSLPSDLPREFFVRGARLSPGHDEPMLVSQWLDRFPACAQSFVFAQTALFSNSTGSA